METLDIEKLCASLFIEEADKPVAKRLHRSDHLPRGSTPPRHSNADDVVVAFVIEKVDGATTSATVPSNSNTGAGVQADNLTAVVGIPCPLHEQSPNADEQDNAIGLHTASSFQVESHEAFVTASEGQQCINL
ncbi:hypothetical protein ACOSQ3_033464 [Xanthoceras sorbifolium]